MKLFKSVLALSVTALLLSGCGGKLGAKTLKMNVSAAQDTVWSVAADTFAQLVEENTDGRWRVELSYADSTEESVRTLERLLDGKADADLRSVSDLQGREERLSVLSLPWLFTDYQDVDRRLFNGSGGETVRNLIRAAGLEPLALAENGFRQVSNDRRPIAAPADFRGLTVRAGNEALESALFTAFGAEPVRMDWDETFPALRDGDVQGQQNTPEMIRSAQVDRVQRYLTVWNSVYDPLCLSVSAQLWAELSEEDKEAFYAAAREACAAEIAASRARDAEILSGFRFSGVQVTVLTPSQIRAFRTAAEPLYDLWRENYGTEPLAALGYSG
ncbi:MAG: TRAP transporter substrate-binding protein DctP [Oscillibacter sp.]|nr:TRAP transporter substrate-binding protein DctP [Oscillibacter sp.]